MSVTDPVIQLITIFNQTLVNLAEIFITLVPTSAIVQRYYKRITTAITSNNRYNTRFFMQMLDTGTISELTYCYKHIVPQIKSKHLTIIADNFKMLTKVIEAYVVISSKYDLQR